MRHRMVWVSLLVLLLAALPSAPLPAQEAKPVRIEKSRDPVKKVAPPRNLPKGSVPADPDNPPELFIAEVEYDAGEVSKGDAIKHDFPIENRGNGTLEIIRVQNSCGCTTSGFDRRIEPGETGKVSLTIETKYLMGPIQKASTVLTNDPSKPSVRLLVKGIVKEILAVRPKEVQQFGLVPLGEAREKEFTLVSKDDAPFEITRIECTDPAMRYELNHAEDRRSATLKALLPADHIDGSINAKFTVYTTHPRVPKVKLSIFGTIRDPINVYPQKLNYKGTSKAFADENPEDRSLVKPITVSLDSFAHKKDPALYEDLLITSVESSIPFIKADLNPIQEGRRYSIKVTFKPPVEVGDFEGILTLETVKKTIRRSIEEGGETTETLVETQKKSFEIPVTGKIF